MPLASSRSAAEKRAKEVQEEKARQERRERLSLPRHARSATRVTQDSAKRRRQAREASEERTKKQIKAPPSDCNDESKGDPEATKENMDTDMASPTSGINKRDAPEEEQLQILSPTPYWKVSVLQGCVGLSGCSSGAAHKEGFHRSIIMCAGRIAT